MLPHKVRQMQCVVFGVLMTLGLLSIFTPRSLFFPSSGLRSSQRFPIANSTLGFGAIAVVSKYKSPRQHRLIQAANVTGLDITIPEQPDWDDEEIEDFKTGPDSIMTPGTVGAWLAHDNVLKWFIDSGLETALIIEDDVDWDIHLRTQQIPRVASSIRSVISGWQPESHESHYWGPPSSWDLMYLGHCGDFFNPILNGVGPGYQVPSDLNNIPHKVFRDNSLPDETNLHPITAALMKALGMPSRSRAVHRSVFPLCTFAYAITRYTALRLVHELAPADEKLNNPGVGAFDTAIMHACRSWMNRKSALDDYAGDLRCWTVNPELFHHMIGDSEIANADRPGGGFYLQPMDQAGLEQAQSRGETSNIGCGFWTGEFGFNDTDTKRLNYLRENVGRKGKCLKPGRH